MALLTLKTVEKRPHDYLQSPGRRGFLRLLLTVAILAVALPQSLTAQDPSYRVKAVFLYNFAQFVTWPEKAFAKADSPLVIGVLGRDPFGRILDETVRGEVVNGRKLEVRRFRSVTEVKECHILFISPSEQPRMLPILDALQGRSILTVGETEQFAINGGVIRFLSEQNKIRFRINTEAAEAAGLTISSKLLRLADIVKTERSPR